MPSAAAGVVIPFWLDRPPTEALEVAALAEELGYSELWVGEMLHFDAMALAGAIASLTRRITITVGPMALGYRKVLGDSGFNELIEASERGISSRHLAEQIGPAILGRIAAVGSLG